MHRNGNGHRRARRFQVILLQWHVTDSCNLRCRHCYQEDRTAAELGLTDLLGILEQFLDLLDDMARRCRLPVRGHVTLTGGEPFVRPDFPDLIEEVAGRDPRLSFAILANGSLIDAPLARWLAGLRPAFVQVSVDGAEETHDRIRGRGNFRRTAAAAKHLVRAGVHTLISFTAHSGNYREFGEVARLGRRLGVHRVWADRLVPWGRGSDMAPLDPCETRELFQLMKRARGAARRSWFCRTEVAMYRALQFLVGGGEPYRCTAGRTLLTVMPNGDLYPCRRMPIRVGNVLKQPIAELYYSSELLRALRDPRRISAGCVACSHREKCGGGLRCLAYATTGNPFEPDPGCWLSARNSTARDARLAPEARA